MSKHANAAESKAVHHIFSTVAKHKKVKKTISVTNKKYSTDNSSMVRKPKKIKIKICNKKQKLILESDD